MKLWYAAMAARRSPKRMCWWKVGLLLPESSCGNADVERAEDSVKKMLLLLSGSCSRLGIPEMRRRLTCVMKSSIGKPCLLTVYLGTEGARLSSCEQREIFLGKAGSSGSTALGGRIVIPPAGLILESTSQTSWRLLISTADAAAKAGDAAGARGETVLVPLAGETAAGGGGIAEARGNGDAAGAGPADDRCSTAPDADGENGTEAW